MVAWFCSEEDMIHCKRAVSHADRAGGVNGERYGFLESANGGSLVTHEMARADGTERFYAIPVIVARVAMRIMELGEYSWIRWTLEAGCRIFQPWPCVVPGHRLTASRRFECVARAGRHGCRAGRAMTSFVLRNRFPRFLGRPIGRSRPRRGTKFRLDLGLVLPPL